LAQVSNSAQHLQLHQDIPTLCQRLKELGEKLLWQLLQSSGLEVVQKTQEHLVGLLHQHQLRGVLPQ
jgi:hypothetical protein